jgi:hypothetical protein
MGYGKGLSEIIPVVWTIVASAKSVILRLDLRSCYFNLRCVLSSSPGLSTLNSTGFWLRRSSCSPLANWFNYYIVYIKKFVNLCGLIQLSFW